MSKLILTEGIAPDTPSATKVAIYAKSGGLLYTKDAVGNEIALSALGVIGAYGCISVQAGSVAETVVDATPRKIEAWNINNIASNTTPDHTTNDITINTAGIYNVIVNLSFSGTGNKTFQLEIYKNSVATGFAIDRKIGSGGDVGSCSINGLISFVETDTLSVYQSTSDGGTEITITEAQLAAHRISA